MKNGPSYHDPPTGWQRRLLGALALATLGVGFWGHWLYEAWHHPGATPHPVTALYHTLQLFILHGVHLEGSIPWQLQAGRLLGGALLFSAALVTFLRFCGTEVLIFRLWLPWRRNHAVICGLGNLGLRLALDGRRIGKFVVAIEKSGDPAATAEARRHGVLVIGGDACEAATLRRARVERAEFVAAACSEDRVNVAVALRLAELLPPGARRAAPLVCRLLVRDLALRQLLADRGLFPHGLAAAAAPTGAQPPPAYVVNFGDLDYHDTAARQALRANPLDFEPIGKDSDLVACLVVVGFGLMGKSLALHAARLGHFANEVTRGHKLRLTVADCGAEATLAEFKRETCGKLDRACVSDFLEVDPRSGEAAEALAAVCASGERDELVTFAVCLERDRRADDPDNARLGIELACKLQGRRAQVLVFQRSRCGFASLMHVVACGARVSPCLHAFGMVEDVFTWDSLLHESEDRVARALHEDYREKRRLDGAPDSGNPTWDELPENLKDSNRQAADHIPIKLRALGYGDAPLEEGRPRIERFDPGEILLLAQMEHVRWCAERWLDCWEYAEETNRARKLSCDLVPWDELKDQERKKDPEQINAVPRALYGAGRGIYGWPGAGAGSRRECGGSPAPPT